MDGEDHGSTSQTHRMTLRQVQDLLSPGGHSALVQKRRAAMIISRVRWVAVVFAVLTPLWIVIDGATFVWPLWGWLALLRLVSSGAFAALAIGYDGTEDSGGAWRALAALLAVPTVFFLVSHPLLNQYEISDGATAVASGYAFLPFVMVAGLSVFPLTALEAGLFTLPLIVAHVTAGLTGTGVLPFSSYLGSVWLLLLLATVAILSAMSQLHFMSALIDQASHDSLSGAFARRVGEELLKVQFSNARRSHAPLSLVFIDIDNFKSINDRYGHEEGDKVLRSAARVLLNGVRTSDMVVRWGGEEFLLILPHTEKDGAVIAIERLRQDGLGVRPDGSPLTASIGIAELLSDHPADWQALVEAADQRMYQAKQNGKNRIDATSVVLAV